MTNTSLTCSYQRIEGIHYPQGEPLSSLTQAEKTAGLCVDEASRFPAEAYRRLINHRQANRDFVPAQWDPCFLQEILDISRTKGVELGIGFDLQNGLFEAEVGTSKELPVHNRIAYLSFVHTHPRAEANSPPTTIFSQQDLYCLLVYATAQNSEAIATVIGSICGGPMEISQIAVDKDKIYVTNEFDQGWVSFLLAEFKPLELEKLMALRGITQFQVVVDPATVNAIGGRHPLPPLEQERILATVRFLDGVRKSDYPLSPKP